jgi:branched-chain amino acid transport system ATP-binding protein
MTVVRDISLTVGPGEIVSLVGRNGAGKTTALSAIAGLRYGPSGGSVELDGRDITRSRAAEITAHGLAHVPEGHRVFRTMTVAENLRLGAYCHRSDDRKAFQASLRHVHSLFPILETYAQRAAGLCSGGEQQMVAIGQALMSRPRLLCLDEPTSGLATRVIVDIWTVLHRLKDEGLAIVIVEQSVDRALRHADRCYVIDDGTVALSGSCAELSGDDRVRSIITGVAVTGVELPAVPPPGRGSAARSVPQLKGSEV